MTNHKDYYAVLEISPQASPRAIAEAYDRLSRRYQPDEDAPPTDPERMSEIDEAFDILDDPQRRAEYDRLRAPPSAAAAAVSEAIATARPKNPSRVACGSRSSAREPLAALAGLIALVFLLLFSDSEKEGDARQRPGLHGDRGRLRRPPAPRRCAHRALHRHAGRRDRVRLIARRQPDRVRPRRRRGDPGMGGGIRLHAGRAAGASSPYRPASPTARARRRRWGHSPECHAHLRCRACSRSSPPARR